MKFTLKYLIVIICLLSPSIALSDWEAKHDDFANRWIVTDGNQQFIVRNEREARKSAKAINKAIKKAAKKESDNGGGDSTNFKGDDCPPDVLC